jgi:DNA-binding CsgD family transcriptional regulator
MWGLATLFAVALICAHNASPVLVIVERTVAFDIVRALAGGAAVFCLVVCVASPGILGLFDSRPSHALALPLLLAGGAVLASIAGDALGGGVLGMVASMLFGGAGLTLLAQWVHLLACYPRKEVCFQGACAMIGAVVLFGVSALLPDALSVRLYLVACFVASVVLFVPAARITSRDDEKAHDKYAAVRSVASWARVGWRSVAGMALSALVLGLVWDPYSANVAIEGSVLFAAALCGVVLLAAGVAIACRIKGEKTVDALDQFGLLAAAIAILLCPYIEVAGTGAVIFVSSCIKEAAFALFFVLAWTEILGSGMLDRVTSARVASGSILIWIACFALGAFVVSHAGTAGRILNGVVLILYVALVALIPRTHGASESEADGGQSGSAASGRMTDGQTSGGQTASGPTEEDVSAVIERRAESLAAAHGLSPRETEVFALLARGHSYAHIAELLFVSSNTVKTHVRNIYGKLGVGSREELFDLIDGEDSSSSGAGVSDGLASGDGSSGEGPSNEHVFREHASGEHVSNKKE